jgi:hypothetical protein
VIHQLNPSDRAFGADPRTIMVYLREGDPRGITLANPFTQSHLLSARLGHTIEQGRDRVHAALEIGGSLKEDTPDLFDSATHFNLEARKAVSAGPLTVEADLQLGLGAADLARQKAFRLGGRPVETQWRSDAFRQVSAAFEAPTADAHLTAFGPAGPVAYLRRFDGRRSVPTGSNVVAGRLSVSGPPFPAVNPLSPLEVEAFSGLGTVWSDGRFLAGIDADALVGDAGIGARYALSSIPHLDRWAAQSDLLQGLDVVAQFPLWASDPALIAPGQNELDFRWRIGLEL